MVTTQNVTNWFDLKNVSQRCIIKVRKFQLEKDRVKSTGRNFVDVRSKHAFELQNDKNMYFLLTKKYFYLVTLKSIHIMYMLN